MTPTPEPQQTPQWLIDIQAVYGLDDNVQDLLQLADAFILTGNQRVAQHLEIIAQDLRKIREQVIAGVKQVVSDKLKHSQELSNLCLETILAVITAAAYHTESPDELEPKS